MIQQVAEGGQSPHLLEGCDHHPCPEALSSHMLE